MSDKIHAQAVLNVEKALKLAGISVAGFSGVVIHSTNSDTQIGGDLLPAGKYVAVEFRVIVPISQ